MKNTWSRMHYISTDHFHMTSRRPYWCTKQWNSGQVGVPKFLSDWTNFYVNYFFCYKKWSQLLTWKRSTKLKHDVSRTCTFLVFYPWFGNLLLPIVCITGALWAKRGERGILREARHARDEGRSKMPRLPRLAHEVPVMQAMLPTTFTRTGWHPWLFTRDPQPPTFSKTPWRHS